MFLMRVRWIALCLLCMAVAGSAATAATARTSAARSVPTAATGSTSPLATGFVGPLFQSGQQTTAGLLGRQAGATYVRLIVSWNSVAPVTLPQSGFDPTDPSSPYYRWDALDASISAAEAAGLTPILDIFAPPGWGYAVQPGTWHGGTPKIDALGAFATALAAHYDGSHGVPAVHVFSVWNEPNFNRNLYPQDPATYREMVNAVADSVHAVDAANLVVAGELAPYKHTASGSDKNSVIPPLTFMRSMLCLSSSSRVRRTCSAPARFDVWSHHPYSDHGPFGHAPSGGVELGDLPKMNTLLDQAQQLGAIDSAKPVQFWVTEFGWSSNAPNKHGAPMGLETRWVAEALYQQWKSGVTLGTWFLLQDQPLSTPFQSGMYFASPSLANAIAKPYLTSFRFPFVAYLKTRGKVAIWGRDATSDKRDVDIQRQIHGSWTTIGTITSNSHGIFEATLPLGATSKWSLRASAPGSGSSSSFSLKVPSNENMKVNPFPLSGAKRR
jgi:hypothetical protein